MLMFYTRTFTMISILGKRTFQPLLIKKSYRSYAQTASAVNHYHYYNDMADAQCSSGTICGYCKGSRFVKCNLCRNGCINCNFTEIIPCPFCNSSGGVYTTDKHPTQSPTSLIKRNQYRVPL